ncbi:MAG TPA: MBOAT family O-acyltransferase [Aggregatilineales bacterium]|nr:MBOAT family O-acyltransferase [Aggregatilineales bacterium]
MSLSLATIGIIALLALPYHLLPGRIRPWLLFIGSIIAIYLLQPALPIRFSDFLLPTAALMLTAALWWWSRAPDQRASREDALVLGLMIAIILGLSLFRFVDAEYRLTPSRPPDPLALLIGLLIIIGGVVVIIQIVKRLDGLRADAINRVPTIHLSLLIVVIVALFITLKTEPVAIALSGLWRSATGQDVTLASPLDLNWLGFSYVAFRLIHTLRDRLTALLPSLTLREYVTYVLFFPAYIAGPIDRAERFVEDLRKVASGQWSVASENAVNIQQSGQNRELSSPSSTDHQPPATSHFQSALYRIALGLFKKFVLADSLASGLALNGVNAEQITSAGWAWVLLYGYALRLFFDFSGYTDIAIGLGMLFGIRLPENFNRPYLKPDITAFWQSWHMTLSNWARFYVFTPLSRWLLRKDWASTIVTVLLAQVVTMTVIGLWHGVTLNFFIWGLWQALGLWIHKQWSDRTRKWYRGLKERPAQKRAWTIVAWFITFHYIVLSWVWFALPGFDQAVVFFGKLVGQ